MNIETKSTKKVVIIGGGLVGALNACFFAQRGYYVHLYEYRPDIREQEHVQGRSINLALSTRGREALACVGLEETIMDKGIEMYARLIHNTDGKSTNRQPYGKTGQFIMSINRRTLNEVLLSLAESHKHVKLHFGHKLIHCKPDANLLILQKSRSANILLTLQKQDSEEMVTISDADLICACDGAFSAVRKSVMAIPQFDYSQEYIGHGYIELNILPTQDDQFALEPNVFHLWPRGEFTLIALANKDKTFTVTLFAPYRIFKEQLHTHQGLHQFFSKYFPDAYKLIGRENVQRTFDRVGVSGLVSIKCSPHTFANKLILMGDAAHAMVPFYGQGMNCGFEDCLILNELLDKHKESIGNALEEYSQTRCADAHAINDLAMYNYLELRDLVNRFDYKLRKRFDGCMQKLLPQLWIPLYSMVTFTRIPYHKVTEARQWQDKILKRMLTGITCVSTISGMAALFYCYKNGIPKINYFFKNE